MNKNELLRFAIFTHVKGLQYNRFDDNWMPDHYMATPITNEDLFQWYERDKGERQIEYLIAQQKIQHERLST